MKRKILIGSIIAVVLLLMMPSIPAIQINSIEEGVIQTFRDKLSNAQSKDGDGITPPGLDFLVWLLEVLSFIFYLIIEHEVIPFIVAMTGAVLFLTIIFIYNVIMFTLFDFIDILHDILVFIKDLFNLPDNRLDLIEIIDIESQHIKGVKKNEKEDTNR